MDELEPFVCKIQPPPVKAHLILNKNEEKRHNNMRNKHWHDVSINNQPWKKS